MTKMILSILFIAPLSSPIHAQNSSKKEPVAAVDKDLVRAAVSNNRQVFRSCLETNSSDGKVVVSGAVNDKGVVTKTKIIKSYNKNTDECVALALKKIDFPPAPKENTYNIKFPFTFNSSKNR